MKKQLLIITFVLSGVYRVVAFPVQKFWGWTSLTELSAHIFVAQCEESPKTPRVLDGRSFDNPLRGGNLGGIVLTDIKITCTLKGDGKPGSRLTLLSQYWPLQGESYLLFPTYCDGTNCQAFDAYRVVPLGHSFRTNVLAGKSLEQKIQTLIEYSAGHLDQEIKREQAEKARLEQGMNPQSATSPTNASPHLDMPLKKP